MAYLKSLLNLRKIAIATLICVSWTTKVPPRLNWANQEFNLALRQYEIRWQVTLTDAECDEWQSRYLKEYLDWWDDYLPTKQAALARGAYR